MSVQKKMLNWLSHEFTTGVSKKDVKYIQVKIGKGWDGKLTTLTMQDINHHLGGYYVHIDKFYIDKVPQDALEFLKSNGAQLARGSRKW